MDKLLVVFTMKGCPFCDMMKDKLNENEIEFVERDIDEHSEEYDLFVEVTENEYVPSFMIIEDINGEPKTQLFAPERDYDEIDDCVKIIKEQFKK
jgi:glutaredoxin